MRGTLRNCFFVLALVSCLGLAPLAYAQGPVTMPNMTSDGDAAWFSGFVSWWQGVWDALTTEDAPVPHTDFATSGTTEPDVGTTSGEGTESMPTGDGDNGTGLDPNGTP